MIIIMYDTFSTEEAILSEERTTDEDKKKIIEGKRFAQAWFN